MKKILLSILCFSFAFSLTACAPNLSPNSYTSDQVGVASTVKRGVIISRRPVNIDNNTGAGGLVGVGAGAVAGSQIGGSGAANALGAIGGAVVGGLLGNAAEKSINHQTGFEYIIRQRNGKVISVVQTQENMFAVGERVMVLYGPTVRILPDDMR